MIHTLSTLLLFIALAFIAGNNLAACVGTVSGSGMLKQRTASLFGASGFLIGLLIQGSQMRKITTLLLPGATQGMLDIVLASTIMIFFIAYIIRTPVPLTMALTGGALGIAVALHLHYDASYVNSIIFMWFLSPILAISASFAAVKLISASRPRSIWRRVSIYKTLLFVVSFLSAYVLGANTMGTVLAFAGFSTINIIAAAIAIFAGSLFLSSGSLRRISQEMYAMRYSSAFSTLSISVILVEAATLFGIPLSNTQAVASSVFGAGITQRHRYLSLRPFLLIVLGWIVASSASFAITYLIR